MKKNERRTLAELLRKCVLRFIEISRQVKFTTLLEVDFASPPSEISLDKGIYTLSPDFNDAFREYKDTDEHKELSDAIIRKLPQQFKARSDEIIKAVIQRSVLTHKKMGYRIKDAPPCWWDDDLFLRGFNDLVYQFNQPENEERLLAPLFNLDVAGQHQIDKQIAIRKATPYDYYTISENDIAASYHLSDCTSVLEIASIDSEDYSDGIPVQKLVELGKIASHVALCLRIFTGSLSHLRFGEFRRETEGLIHTSSFLLDHPEMGLIDNPDSHFLQTSHIQGFAVFWKNYEEGLNQSHFARSVERFDSALSGRDSTSKFIDYVLALEALFSSILAHVQYRAAALISHRSNLRCRVYDFLDIVTKQRNPIMHGSSGFGRGFQSKLKNFYGESTSVERFISDLGAVVRQCLRLSIMSGIIDSEKWASQLTEAVLQKKTNRSLVGYSKKWTLLGKPSFF